MRKKLWLCAAMFLSIALLGSGVFPHVAELITKGAEVETMNQQMQSDFNYTESIVNYDKTDVRYRAQIDLNWKFIQQDVAGAEKADFDDSSWRLLNLPHDWSIEGEYDQGNASGGSGGYLPTGIGWYRKELTIPAEWQDGRQVSIAFDGVFTNSTVYVDGEKVGGMEYGWLSFSCDITEQVRGKSSVTVAVRVDNSVQPAARWYTGSGIYSHVWLLSTEDVHVAENGTYVLTPGEDKGKPNGDVNLETLVKNDGTSAVNASVRSTIFKKSDNSQAAQVTSNAVTVPAGGDFTVSQTAHVDNPALWSVDEPNLYYVYTEILVNGTVVDDYYTDFGFRHISYDVTGLYLNGVNTELKGVANHWALGAIGAAQSDNMIRYKIQLMKDMGVNCIRTAHNACPPVFYQLCDEMGMMVLDEFSEGEKGKVAGDYATRWFKNYWQRDIEYWLRRDRNHPSVVVWSIGNETGSQYDNTGIGAFIDNFDTSRPTTGSWIYYGVDIPGANGVSERSTYASAQRPADIQNLPLIATEAPHTHAVRGVYRTRTWARGTITETVGGGNHLPHLSDNEIFRYDWSSGAVGARTWASDYDNAVSQISVRQHWTLTRDNDWRIGEFRWTGFDYLGEANYVLGGWPYRMFHSGAVDTALFEKSMYYLYQSMWLDTPVLHILPSWTHPTMEEGTVVPVWVYSNCESVELFLNGVSLGKETRGPMDQREYLEIQFDWDVPYAPGTLTAVGYDANGNEILRDTYKTASAPAAITLENTTGEGMPTDPQWVGQVTVTTVDKDGNFYPYGENRAYYYVSGPAYIKAADNGSPTDVESHVNYNRNAFMGLSKVFVSPTQDSGDILFTAASILGEKRQLTSNLVNISVQQLALRGNPAKQTFEIYYTTDGSVPTKSSARYEGAFEVAMETTVKAAVYVAGSDVPMFLMEEAFGADEGMFWAGTGAGSTSKNAAYAEDAVLEGETIELSDYGYDAHYANFRGNGGSVEFSYTADKAGDYYMAVCYNNGSGTIGESKKSMGLTVNGTFVGNYSYIANGSWDTFWSYRMMKVSLVSGENKIKFTASSAGANLWHLYFWPADDVYTANEAILLNADSNDSVNAHETSFDGKAVDVGSNGGTAGWKVSAPAGNYKIAFWYSTPNGSLREVSMKVNGKTVAMFSGKKVSPNYGATWGMEEVELYLAPGVNEIAVTAPTGGTLIGGLTLLPVDTSSSLATVIDASCVEDVRLAGDVDPALTGTGDVSTNATWNIIVNPEGLLYLVNRESGKLLASDGKKLTLALRDTDGNALWTRVSETEHYDYIRHVNSGKVIALSEEGELFMDDESNYLPGNLETNRAYWYFHDLPDSEFKFDDGTPTQKTADAKPFIVTARGGKTSGKVIYSVVSGPATIDEARGRVTLTGETGTVVIKAERLADGQFEAVSATHTITVRPSQIAYGPTDYYPISTDGTTLANGVRWESTSTTSHKIGAGSGDAEGVYFGDHNNQNGAFVITVNAEEAGDYYVAVGGVTSGTRYLYVSVNGGTDQKVTFTKNGGWYTVDSYHIIKVTLNKGANEIALARKTDACPAVSGIMVWSVNEWHTAADNPALAGAATALDRDFAFDGKAYDVGNSAGSLTWNITVPVSGTYRAVIPYASGNSSSALTLAVDGKTVATTGPRKTTGGYEVALKFVTTEEFKLSAGENLPVTLSWSGGAYLSGVRLELVNADPEVTDFDVTWTGMEFTYDKGDWNADTHKYENGGWVHKTDAGVTDASVTVKNVGETDITAELDYSADANYKNYQISILANGFENGPVELWAGDSVLYAVALNAPVPTEAMNAVPVGTLTLLIRE